MRIRLKLRPKQTASRSGIPINYNGVVAQYVYSLLDPDEPLAGTPGAGAATSRELLSTASNGYSIGVSSSRSSGVSNGASNGKSNAVAPIASGGIPAEAETGIPYYTFSNLYIPQVEQAGDTLIFGDVDAELTISVVLERAYEESLLERVCRPMELAFDSGSTFELRQVDVLSEPESFPGVTRFRMASPLASPVVEPGPPREDGIPEAPRFLHHSTEEFQEALREILLARYERLRGRLPHDKRLRVELDEQYVSRRRGKISKLVTIDHPDGEQRRIRAIVAPFRCAGNPELIALGYSGGFGEKNVLGFGCVELAGIPSMILRSIPVESSSTGSNDAKGHLVVQTASRTT